MTIATIRTPLAIILWVTSLAALFSLSNMGAPQELPGTRLITKMNLCTDNACKDSTSVSLPFFTPMGFSSAIETRRLWFEHEFADLPEMPQAIYVPKLSDNLDIMINGQMLHDNDLPRRLWSTPVLGTVPPAMLTPGVNRFDIVLYGTPSKGLELRPFYLGDRKILASKNAVRFFWGPGLARLGLLIMLVLFAVNMIIWLGLRDDFAHLYLGLSCIVALPILWHYSYQISPMREGAWTMLWVACVGGYLLYIISFVRHLLQLPAFTHERLFFWFLIGWLVAIPLVPDDYGFAVAFLLAIFVALFAFSILVIFWNSRGNIAQRDFWVLFVCMSVAAALGLYDNLLLVLPKPPMDTHLFHVMPIVMSITSLWLIISNLLTNFNRLEALTEQQEQIIASKSAELAANFEQMADVRQREAILEERERIMLDLHDGVGGQLANTLAYMRDKQIGDSTTFEALEHALRDLALILDSLENHDSLITLLGMIRARVEGLLEWHGVTFDWQVKAEPALTNAGPSNILSLARIVQEAITNTLKHADADTITVYVDTTCIRISDNGTGFDPQDPAILNGSSYGLSSIRRRSEAVGAVCDIQSGSSGTEIALYFNTETDSST